MNAERLLERIRLTREAGERLDKLDYLKRYWLADYAADVDIIGDALQERLSGEPIAWGQRALMYRLMED